MFILLLTAASVFFTYVIVGFLIGSKRNQHTNAGATSQVVEDAITKCQPLSEQTPDTDLEVETLRVLLRLVGGDSRIAQRLIAFEKHRTPLLARSKLIQNAIDRLRIELRCWR